METAQRHPFVICYFEPQLYVSKCVRIVRVISTNRVSWLYDTPDWYSPQDITSRVLEPTELIEGCLGQLENLPGPADDHFFSKCESALSTARTIPEVCIHIHIYIYTWRSVTTYHSLCYTCTSLTDYIFIFPWFPCTIWTDKKTHVSPDISHSFRFRNRAGVVVLLLAQYLR